MHKNHLITPGPTPVHPRVLLAMAQEMIHHRGPAFKEIFAEVREHLKWLFQTEQEVLTLTCSGTGAFEAAIINFTRREDTLIAVGGGKFGERWGKIAHTYGMNVVTMDIPWGEAADPAVLQSLLAQHPNVAMVTVCASETSTGVFHPIRELAEVVRTTDALVAVDAITALGVHELPMDAWGLDLVVAGSQKAFSLPPGLGFVAASKRAWDRAKSSDHPRFYFDLQRELANQVKNQTAFTPAISLVVGLLEMLRIMREEGLSEMIARHARLAEGTREAARALGLGLFATQPSNAVTTISVPQNLSAPDIVLNLRKEGIVIASGQDHLKDSTFRFGHLGYYDESDIIVGIAALERVLKKLGHNFELGAGLAASQTVFLKGAR